MMEKLFIAIALFAVFLLPVIFPVNTYARIHSLNNFLSAYSYNGRLCLTPSSSACTFGKNKNIQLTDDKRLSALNTFLNNYRSDLAGYSSYLVDTADKYDLPWTLLPAIAGVESGFCRKAPKNSYNCWGWNNGNFHFADYYQAIDTISKGLKEYYFNHGLNTPELIGKKYAPPSSAFWSQQVSFFIINLEVLLTDNLQTLQFTL